LGREVINQKNLTITVEGRCPKGGSGSRYGCEQGRCRPRKNTQRKAERAKNKKPALRTVARMGSRRLINQELQVFAGEEPWTSKETADGIGKAPTECTDLRWLGGQDLMGGVPLMWCREYFSKGVSYIGTGSMPSSTRKTGGGGIPPKTRAALRLRCYSEKRNSRIPSSGKGREVEASELGGISRGSNTTE